VAKQKNKESGSHDIRVGGDAIASALGAGAEVNAGDITVTKRGVDQSWGMDAEALQAFKQAEIEIGRADLSAGDSTDAKDDLAKLKDVLEKREPDVGRARRLFKHIQEIAPTAAAILSAVVSITKLLSLNHPPE